MSDLKPWPRCTVCGLRKKPIGRDAAAAAARGNCNHECEGYRLDPQPGYLWRFIAERTPEPKEDQS